MSISSCPHANKMIFIGNNKNKVKLKNVLFMNKKIYSIVINFL